MSAKETTSLTLRLPYWSIGLLFMFAIETVAFALDGFEVAGNTLHDYDTVTRMAYLREVLERHTLGHGFFERLNPPYGMVLHWTLPFNLILLALIKLFSLFNAQMAVQYAGYWTGTLFRIAIAPAAYWAGRQILTPAASSLASILILFSPYLLDYAHRGAANHHALMYLETVLMAGLAFRLIGRPTSDLRLPLAMGAMTGLCLWTTFEMVIIIAPLLAILFYLWAMQGEARLRQLLLTCAAFSITTTIALLVDAPYGGMDAPVLDHISMPFQSLASLPLLIALGAWLIRTGDTLRRAAYVVASGLVCALGWLAFYPFAVRGVQGAMDPYVVREWLSNIEEVMPIAEWRKVIGFLGPVILAAVFAVGWQVERTRRESLLASLGCLYILGQLHFRFALYATVAAPYFLAYVYDRSLRANGEFPAFFTRAARPVALGLVVAYILMQASMVLFDYNVMDKPSNEDDDVPDSVTCNPWSVRVPMSDAAWLGSKDPIVVAETNQAATLLYWTDVRPLAGNYHRDSAGIKDDYLFFRDLGDEAAKEIVKRRGADYVLLCGNGNNVIYSFVSQADAAKELKKPGEEFDPENTMYTRLTDQKPPPWLVLKPWPDDIDSDLLLYKVDKSKLD